MFVPPIPLIRRNHIIRKLRACGAMSPLTAVSFEEAGILFPNKFSLVKMKMLRDGRLCQTGDGRFFLAR